MTLPAEMALSVALASGSISSRAASPTAKYIFSESWKTRRHLQNSLFLGLGGDVFNELYDVLKIVKSQVGTVIQPNRVSRYLFECISFS